MMFNKTLKQFSPELWTRSFNKHFQFHSSTIPKGIKESRNNSTIPRFPPKTLSTVWFRDSHGNEGIKGRFHDSTVPLPNNFNSTVPRFPKEPRNQGTIPRFHRASKNQGTKGVWQGMDEFRNQGIKERFHSSTIQSGIQESRDQGCSRLNEQAESRDSLIHLFVNGRPNVICLQEDQRETLFNVVNSYMDDSDSSDDNDV